MAEIPTRRMSVLWYMLDTPPPMKIGHLAQWLKHSPKRRTLQPHSHAENELETEREPEDGF